MEMLGQAGNSEPINSASFAVPNLPKPLSKRMAMSGQWSWKASMMASADHRKMPEFQKNSPLCTNTFANSSLGFSVNVLTFVMPSSTSSLLIWM